MRKPIAALIAALITGCSSAGPAVVMPTVLSPTPELATLALPSATPTAAPTPTAPPSFQTPVPITDVSQVFSSGASGWRPGGTTLVIGTASASGATTLVALQLGPRGNVAPPVSLVTFLPGGWSLRADGGAVAVSVARSNASRIAIWDIRSGTARWLTAAESGMAEVSPVWSKDGGSIYYMSSAQDGKGSGIYQIGADGSGKKLIMAADERTGPPQGLTPDGKGLIWSRGQAGGSVEILDIATGVSRHLEDVAHVVSWRSAQPRALLMVGGCCAGRPGGSLVAWDDIALTSRVVAERAPFGAVAWGVGAWDPTGTRVAAVRFDDALIYEGTLVILDPATGATEPVAGTEGAGNIQWLAEGLVYFIQHDRQPSAEVMFLPDAKGTPVSLYKTGGLQGVTIVRP